MYKKLIVLALVLGLMVSMAQAGFEITNGDFEADIDLGTDTENVSLWYDDISPGGGFWESAWQLNRADVTPNGTQVVVFSGFNPDPNDPLVGSYVYQSIGTSSGEASITIGFDWGHPDDVAAGRLDGVTVSVLASDGSFVASDGNDVLGAAGVTLLDSASYDHVAEGTDGEVFAVEVELDLSGANVGDEIFLRFNNTSEWPILDNVQIISEAASAGVVIENASFELPGTDKQNCWDGGTNNKGTFVDVPGWSSDTMAADSGVETGWNATDGEWTGFLMGSDPSVWQLTDYVIGADDVLVLQIDAANNWAATTLRLTIYYDDAGARVPAASADVELTDTMATYSMTFVAADAPDSIGKVLGVEFDNVTEEGSSWIGIDNVRVGPPPPLANIVLVSFHEADDVIHEGAAGAGFTEAPDKGYSDLLTDAGYGVTRYVTTSTPDPNVLNAADLVIISRSIGSGDYSNDGATAWNNITAPMIVMSGYTLRTSRMGYTTGTTMVDTAGDISLAVADPTHPIFKGISITDGVMDNAYAGVVTYPTDGVTVARGISVNTDPANEDGTVLATVATADDPTVGGMVIGEWPAGSTMNHSGGAETDILPAPRLVFLTGSREADGVDSRTAGIFDLYPDGAQMLLNAVAYMLPLEPTHSYTFEDGTTADSADAADGVLVGNAAVRGGKLDLEDGGYMSMPGDVIAMNTYDEVTVELWFTSVPGGNTGFHMITAFGEEGTGAADWAGYKYLFITPARGDDVSRVAIQTRSMDDSPWDEETGVSAAVEHDDGLQHYFVCTVDDAAITFYIDGELIGSAALDPNESIAGIGTDVAYIGKGVYPVDPCWVGSVEELNIYDRVMSSVQVAAHNAAGPVKFGPEPIDPGVDGLLAYYPLDAAYRGSVPDDSGNGNDGTVMGDPAFVPGIVAQAIDLDGDGDYVDCGANTLFGMQETNEMTAACWLTIRSIGGDWRAVVAKGENAWRLGNVNLDPRFHFGISIWNAADTPSVDGVTAVGFDEWHHVAGVYGGGQIMVYLDGALDANVPTTQPIGTNELNVFIGDNPEAIGRYWDGLVDEVLIYNRALSVNEVLFLAQ